MNCPACSSNILDDCLYCPKCGKPTPLSAEHSVNALHAVAPRPAQVLEPQVISASVSEASPKAVVLPSDARALNNRLTQANLSRVRGNWNEAIDHCVAVLQADPSNASAHAMLGDIYAARGRREDAIQWYRMALELHPNPVDEAKLHRVERELEQRENANRKGNRLAEAAPAIPGDGQGAVGTVALMGVSPRLWLRGITVAALAFLIVSGAILLSTQNRHAQDASLPRPLNANQVTSIAPAQGSLGTLPPPRLGGESSLPNGQGTNAVPPPQVGGSGLAPDSNAATRTVPTSAPADRRNGANTMSAPPQTPNIPTAPVRSVRPIGAGDMPVFATLSGGMKLAKMSPLSAGDESVLVLANPPGSGEQENFRQEAIRNVYRAARNAFITNNEAKVASVYIQTDLTEKGGSVLLSAHIDRDSALKSDPETERPESLLHRLRSVRWGQ